MSVFFELVYLPRRDEEDYYWTADSLLVIFSLSNLTPSSSHFSLSLCDCQKEETTIGADMSAAGEAWQAKQVALNCRCRHEWSLLARRRRRRLVLLAINQTLMLRAINKQTNANQATQLTHSLACSHTR